MGCKIWNRRQTTDDGPLQYLPHIPIFHSELCYVLSLIELNQYKTSLRTSRNLSCFNLRWSVVRGLWSVVRGPMSSYQHSKINYHQFSYSLRWYWLNSYFRG